MPPKMLQNILVSKNHLPNLKLKKYKPAFWLMFFSIPNFKGLTFFCFTVNLYLIHQEMKKIDQKWCWNLQMNMKIGKKYFVAPWKMTSILTYNDCIGLKRISNMYMCNLYTVLRVLREVTGWLHQQGAV